MCNFSYILAEQNAETARHVPGAPGGDCKIVSKLSLSHGVAATAKLANASAHNRSGMLCCQHTRKCTTILTDCLLTWLALVQPATAAPCTAGSPKCLRMWLITKSR